MAKTSRSRSVCGCLPDPLPLGGLKFCAAVPLSLPGARSASRLRTSTLTSRSVGAARDYFLLLFFF